MLYGQKDSILPMVSVKSEWIKQKMNSNSDTEIPAQGIKNAVSCFFVFSFALDHFQILAFNHFKVLAQRNSLFFLIMVLMECQHFKLTISNMCYVYVLFSLSKGNNISIKKIKVETSQIEWTVTFLVFMEFMFTFRNNRTIWWSHIFS